MSAPRIPLDRVNDIVSASDDPELIRERTEYHMRKLVAEVLLKFARSVGPQESGKNVQARLIALAERYTQ